MDEIQRPVACQIVKLLAARSRCLRPQPDQEAERQDDDDQIGSILDRVELKTEKLEKEKRRVDMPRRRRPPCDGLLRRRSGELGGGEGPCKGVDLGVLYEEDKRLTTVVQATRSAQAIDGGEDGDGT
ncbi:hypothetical protein TRIUR3_34728 [Triticum urartu]|uniref:Uncharacterized protein n=1 Tax=Triticum urartu TaxID=4572 RepID=M7Z5Y8_TRIUA|nr:hypothetical protein TRIUR3_34728 [Triticum urartu]